MFRWPRTLDASPIFSPSKLTSTSHTRRSFACELVSHLQRYGFARVRNHAVAPATRKALFDYHRKFFALPLAAKLSVRHPGGEAPARGYSPWAYEKTAILRPDLHNKPNIDHLLQSSNASSDCAAVARSQQLISAPTTSSQVHLAQSPTAQHTDQRQANQSGPATSPPQSSSLLDAREQFAIGPPHDTQFPTPHLAPHVLPNFSATTRLAYQEMRSTCLGLVSAVEEGLGLPANAIGGPAGGGAGAELNLNFYPEVERRVLERRTAASQTHRGDDAHVGDDAPAMRRIWPHSDLGVVSGLLQDGVGASGLELQVRQGGVSDGAFAPLDVEQEGDLVLLVSDTLERWTNGHLRAAVHRVGLPSGALPPDALVAEPKFRVVPERRSAVMFYRAPPTADLGPLPYFVDASNPARYEHMNASDYLKWHNARLY